MKLKSFFLVVALMACYVCEVKAQASKSGDFEFAVQVIENDYAGFSSKVTEQKQIEYDKLKLSLRTAISKGENENDCIGRYISWFNDAHLYYQTSQLDKGKNYNYVPATIAKKVDAHTFLIRVSSFGAGEEQSVANMVEQYKTSGCENLIIDIRCNGGGVDDAFLPLIDLIYTHKGVLDGVEWLSSKNNIKAFKESISKMSNEGIRAYYNKICEKMELHPGKFVDDGKPSMEFIRNVVSELPSKVAIVIDGNVASSAEQFVIHAKACCDKVMIYGKDNTMGVLDFSNRISINLPNSNAELYYPISRSKRLPDRGIDETGIEPDVRITLPYPETVDTEIDQWMTWISKDMIGKQF